MIYFEVGKVIKVLILIFFSLLVFYGIKQIYIVIVNSYLFILLLVVLKIYEKMQQNPKIEVF